MRKGDRKRQTKLRPTCLLKTQRLYQGRLQPERSRHQDSGNKRILTYAQADYAVLLNHKIDHFVQV